MKKILLTIILGIFLLANIMALDSLGTFKQNDNVRITQVCNDATYITLTSISYPNSTSAVGNFNMTSSNGEFIYNFNLTDTIGRYDVRGISDGCEGTFATYFEVTSTGGDINFSYLIAMVFLVLVFLSLGVMISRDKEKINDDKYWNKITSRYMERQYLKFSALAVWYNLRKNSYILQYLIGLMVIVLVYDLTKVYYLISAESIIGVMLSLYSWGALIVVMVLFGNVQEWIADWLKQLEDMKWGENFSGSK